MARPAHRRRRIHRHDLAGDQPVEEVADRRKLLLDGGSRKLAALPFDPARYMQGLDLGQGSDVPTLAPGEKLTHRPVAGGCNQRRQGRTGKSNELTHSPSAVSGAGTGTVSISPSLCAQAWGSLSVSRGPHSPDRSIELATSKWKPSRAR